MRREGIVSRFKREETLLDSRFNGRDDHSPFANVLNSFFLRGKIDFCDIRIISRLNYTMSSYEFELIYIYMYRVSQ